jgi:hypothetical protein
MPYNSADILKQCRRYSGGLSWRVQEPVPGIDLIEFVGTNGRNITIELQLIYGQQIVIRCWAFHRQIYSSNKGALLTPEQALQQAARQWRSLAAEAAGMFQAG